MGDLITVVLLQAIACGLFCGYIAREKGRNHFLWFGLGYFFSLFALLSLVALPRVESRTASAPESLPSPFDGQRRLDEPAYQLFLTRRFGIERNDTLDVFVIGDKVFGTLAEALADADLRYGQLLDEFAREQARQEREAQRRTAEALRQQELLKAEAQRKSEELQQQRKARREAIRRAIPWTAGAIAAIAVGGALLFALERSVEQGRCDRGETPWVMKETTDFGALRQCSGGGLLWTRSDNGHDVGWIEAESFCRGLDGGGWRLPTAAQLQSLYREELRVQSCGGNGCRVSDLFRLGSSSHWSSEPNGPSEAWAVDLSNGSRQSFLMDNAHYRGRALCARRP